MNQTVILIVIGTVFGSALSCIVYYWLQKNIFLPELDHRVSSKISLSLLDLTQKLLDSTAQTRDSLTHRLSQSAMEQTERLERSLKGTTQVLESKFQTLEGQVGIRLEAIGKSVETKLDQNLKEGFMHFEKVQQHLQAAELKLASLAVVGQSISDLNNLLKLPHLRGGFGEATLERLLADFLPIGTYELQYQISPLVTERVDAVVKLAKQILPIDSKFPREQVLPLFESDDPKQLEIARKMLADFIRSQAKTIKEKYIKPECGTTDMALIFLPSETLYFEVVRNGKLFEDLSKMKVFPVSPNTLAISLKSVAMAQDYYMMAKGVEKTIEEIQKARKHFDNFENKFDEIGKGLRKAQEAYDVAHTHLGRYESSVGRLTGGSELRSLGAPSETPENPKLNLQPDKPLELPF